MAVFFFLPFFFLLQLFSIMFTFYIAGLVRRWFYYNFRTCYQQLWTPPRRFCGVLLKGFLEDKPEVPVLCDETFDLLRRLHPGDNASWTSFQLAQDGF